MACLMGSTRSLLKYVFAVGIAGLVAGCVSPPPRTRSRTREGIPPDDPAAVTSAPSGSGCCWRVFWRMAARSPSTTYIQKESTLQSDIRREKNKIKITIIAIIIIIAITIIAIIVIIAITILQSLRAFRRPPHAMTQSSNPRRWASGPCRMYS